MVCCGIFSSTTDVNCGVQCYFSFFQESLLCVRVSYSKDDTITQNGINTGFTIVTGLYKFAQC